MRRFWTDLPREGRMLLSIVVVEFFGTGLILPFAVVYLHQVRGFSLGTAGLLLALVPLLGLVTVGPGGTLVDRVGARRVVVGVLVLTLVSDVVLAFATTPTAAALALVISGAAGGAQWPAFQSLVATVIPADLRPRYFGVNFTLLNLGIGAGGVVGGLFVDVARPVTFEAVYLADAASFLPALVLLLGPLRHAAGAVARPTDADASAVSYRAVLRSRAMPAMLTITFVSSFVGYSQLNAGMPAFATTVARVSTRGLGFAFAANTLLIVLLQLVVLQRIEGRRRTRVVVWMSLIWAVSWLALGSAGLVPGTLGATLLVAACASVFALGETLLQPTLPVLLNDLAPDHLRGRYNAINQAAFQLAAVISPPVAGFLIGHGLGAVYVGLLVVGCVVLAVLSVVRLEPQLPPEVNGVREPTVEPSVAPS